MKFSMEYKLRTMCNFVFNKFSVPTLTYGLSLTSHLICMPSFRLGSLLQEFNSGTVTINWNVTYRDQDAMCLVMG